MEITDAERRLLFEQADARYLREHRETQLKYGLHTFGDPDTTLPYFDANEAVALDNRVFHVAAERLWFWPTIDLFAKYANAQLSRYLSPRPC